MKPILAGYKTLYSTLTKKFKDENPRGYDLGIIYTRALEFNKGYATKKIFKPSSKGTCISFRRFDSDRESMLKHAKEIDVAVGEYNDKYPESTLRRYDFNGR